MFVLSPQLPERAGGRGAPWSPHSPWTSRCGPPRRHPPGRPAESCPMWRPLTTFDVCHEPSSFPEPSRQIPPRDAGPLREQDPVDHPTVVLPTPPRVQRSSASEAPYGSIPRSADHPVPRRPERSQCKAVTWTHRTVPSRPAWARGRTGWLPWRCPLSCPRGRSPGRQPGSRR